jgi:osmotically-inducible protein OsmY
MKGGKVKVEIANEEVFLTGEVARVLYGHFAKDFAKKYLNKI